MIPQDIIVEILNFLDTDRRALKACSLVSPSIRAHSQRRLFRFVALDLRCPFQHVRLHQAFSSNPALPDFVLHLQLVLYDCPVDTICDVLCQLNNVRGVSLKYFPSWIPDSDDGSEDDERIWEDLHIQIRDFVARIICLPTCQYLSLSSRMYFPVQFVARLTHLRHLQFTNSSFSWFSSQDIKVPTESHLQLSQDEGSLEVLTITKMGYGVNWALRSPLSLARLRVCHITCMYHTDGIKDIFDVCPLLEKVHLDFLCSAPSSLDFKSLKHLQVVCISVNADEMDGGWLAQALATLPFISLLGLSVCQDIMTKEQWSSLDHTLAQRGDHGNKEVLPRVVWHPRLPLKEKWLSILEENLPRLVGKGMVIPASTQSLVYLNSTWKHDPPWAFDWPMCTSCFPDLPSA